MDTLFSHVNIVTMNEQMTLWQDAFAVSYTHLTLPTILRV